MVEQRLDVEGSAVGDHGGRALVDALVQLSFIVQGIMGRLADQHGLTTTSVRMLAVLDDREIGMQQLAAILELEKSSVTGLVNRAERRGLVERRVAPDDGRAVLVTATASGRDLIRAAKQHVSSEIADLATALSARRRDQLGGLVSVLIDRYVDLHSIPL